MDDLGRSLEDDLKRHRSTAETFFTDLKAMVESKAADVRGLFGLISTELTGLKQVRALPSDRLRRCLNPDSNDRISGTLGDPH